MKLRCHENAQIWIFCYLQKLELTTQLELQNQKDDMIKTLKLKLGKTIKIFGLI